MCTMLRTEEINCCHDYCYHHHQRRGENPRCGREQGGRALTPQCGEAEPPRVEKVLAEYQLQG